MRQNGRLSKKMHQTIIVSVDSLCSDGTDTLMLPYTGKAFTRTNVEDVSLFRYLIMVCEWFSTQRHSQRKYTATVIHENQSNFLPLLFLFVFLLQKALV